MSIDVVNAVRLIDSKENAQSGPEDEYPEGNRQGRPKGEIRLPVKHKEEKQDGSQVKRDLFYGCHPGIGHKQQKDPNDDGDAAVHKISVDFPDNFPIVSADETRLEQVLSNLVSNAIKYSPQGGEIQITGQVRPAQVIICISDQGPGVAPEDIPHIFDRFYRSSNVKRTTKGAGLGLYLARAVIEAHGGRIWVDPRPGNGARICFSLPRN